MEKLETASSIPLYKQLSDKLTSLIEEGRYQQGSRFPTEEEISELFNVSRVTVRKALEPLTENGVLERIAGKGTFVSRDKITRDIVKVMSFTEMCKRQGHVPGAITIKFSLDIPDDKEVTALQLKEGQKVIVLERLRFADDIPVVLETTKFSDDFYFLFNEDLNNNSLYDLLKDKGIKLTDAQKAIDIVRANFKEANYLEIKKNDPLLRIESLVFSEDGKHRHLSKQLCVSSRFKFLV